MYVYMYASMHAVGAGPEAGRRRNSSASRGSFLQSIATAKVKLLDTLKEARVVPTLASMSQVKVTHDAYVTTLCRMLNLLAVNIFNSALSGR